MVDRRTKEYKAANVAPVRRADVDGAQQSNMSSLAADATQAAERAATAATAAQQAASATLRDLGDPEAVAPKFRRKRASTGGFKLKLDAPQRPGFVRRFVKNDPSRIMSMQEMGYDFAEADTRTDGLGARITRHSGKGENGAPEHLVLMETPESEYAVGVAEKEEQRQPFEQALRAGRATSGELTDQYEPRHDRSSLSHTGQ